MSTLRFRLLPLYQTGTVAVTHLSDPKLVSRRSDVSSPRKGAIEEGEDRSPVPRVGVVGKLRSSPTSLPQDSKRPYRHEGPVGPRGSQSPRNRRVLGKR